MGRFKRLFDRVTWRPERPIDLAIAAMVILATMLLGASYRAPLAVWSALLLVGASIYLNDVTGWFRLDRKWANWLSLTAVAVWCLEARLLEGDWQLVAITYVLLILQIILLFQAKSDRIACQVVLLSIGQVAVAAGLSPGFWFAPLLVLYTIVGLVALALLGMNARLAHLGETMVAMPQLAGAPFEVARSTHEAFRPLGGADRLRFSAEPVVWSRAQWRRALVRQTVCMTAVTLVLTFVVFLLFPRIERQREETFEDGLRSVGFSLDVNLEGKTGTARQDPGDVLRIRFFQEPGHIPMQLLGEPLLRGTVATEYAKGRWWQPSTWTTRRLKALQTDHYVTQQVTIEPLRESTLFGIFPAGSINEEDPVQINDLGTELLRADRMRYRRFDYQIGTTAIQGGRQMPLVPLDEYMPLTVREDYSDHPQDYLLQMPEARADGIDPLAGLKALADSVRQQAGLQPEQHYEIAQAMVRYLRDGGKFEYSDAGQPRPAGVDPLEDFVTTHRLGHCEFFAGALAMMLRSQGIPARVAIGFRTNEWNSAGGYYLVRQLHAHAWVEAVLDPQHFAHLRLPGQDLDWSKGAWLTLDATPSGQNAATDSDNLSLWGRAGMYIDYLQVLWGRFVSGLNYLTQQEAIYQPLAAFFSDIWENLSLLRQWLGLPPLSELGFIGRSWSWYRENWFSVSGFFSTFAILLGLAGIVVLAKRAMLALRRFARRALAPVGPRTSNNEIYGRLERVLARHGYERASGQTPYEFALSAGGELAERPGCSPLAALPRRVVEVFYRVRFGRHPLDSSEAEAVEHALSALERGLSQAPARG